MVPWKSISINDNNKLFHTSISNDASLSVSDCDWSCKYEEIRTVAIGIQLLLHKRQLRTVINYSPTWDIANSNDCWSTTADRDSLSSIKASTYDKKTKA